MESVPRWQQHSVSPRIGSLKHELSTPVHVVNLKQPHPYPPESIPHRSGAWYSERCALGLSGAEANNFDEVSKFPEPWFLTKRQYNFTNRYRGLNHFSKKPNFAFVLPTYFC